MSVFFADSAQFYSQERRRRARSYQAYLAGDADDVGAIVGAETAAFSEGGAWRSIGVGVATGALTYLATRILESLLFPRSRQ